MRLLHQKLPLKILLSSLAILTICISIFLACTRSGGQAQIVASPLDGNQKMAALLENIARKINTPANGYAAQAKIAHFDSLINVASNPNQKINAVMKKAIILLEYGDEATSVSLFEQILRFVGNQKEARIPTLYWLGTAYMRLAERNNCVSGHSADACIMPLKNSGIHQDKTAARKAIEIFETYLTEAPDDKNYNDGLWLLNIAYMAVGEYPNKVPKKWLVPGLDVPEYQMKPFTDVATDLKIMVNDRAGGTITEDFDNDGDLDIVTSAWDIGAEPMHYFRNNGDGTFSDLSVESKLSMFRGGLNIQQTDYNNDGNLDIFVLRGAWQGQAGPFGEQPNSLLRNNGDGTFTDVTVEAGLLSFCPTQTATWNDFNHDGWLDLFIGNETMPTGNIYPCELYINNHDGTFKNVAAAWGMDYKVFVKGAISGDYNNDGWADIFLSTMNGKRILLENKGVQGDKVVFENVTEKAGFAKEEYRSFPTFFFDYDNDGFLDIFVCNYDFERTISYYAAKEALKPSNDNFGKPNIYHNNGDGTFTNVTPSMNINKVCFSMGANFGDFNNDGFLDFYLGTGNPNYQSIIPNRLFMNIGGKKFADGTVSARVGNIQKGHGVAISDIDNDGDQDIHIEMGGAYRGDGYPSSLYLNPGQNNNNWIYLKLEGVKSNRAAIGAKIKVKFHENGQERTLYRELNSGGSFGSSTLRREIGVGRATLIDEITINWPASGVTQVFNNIKPNQVLKIKEDQQTFEAVSLNPIAFKHTASAMPMCAPAK